MNVAKSAFFRFIFLQHFRVDLNGLNQLNVFLAKYSLCYVFLNEFRIYFLFTPKTLGRVTRKMDGLLLQAVCNPKGPSLAKRKKNVVKYVHQQNGRLEQMYLFFLDKNQGMNLTETLVSSRTTTGWRSRDSMKYCQLLCLTFTTIL